SAVYQNLTVPALAKQLLESYGFVEGETYEFVVNEQRSPTREYMVQYRESDWSFIARWLEREGYFYWYRHTPAGACLVIADNNGESTEIAAPTTLLFAQDGLSSGEDVLSLRVRQRQIPAQVAVADYNYRAPEERLLVVRPVDDQGFGHVITYDNHFKTSTEGGVVADTRAERFRATEQEFVGKTDCMRMRVGHRFTMTSHGDDDYNKTYLITSTSVKVGQDPRGMRGAGNQPSLDFTAISMDVPFRPARAVPWPRIDAFVTGHVEGEGAGEYAQIDEHGRYKIRMTFDMGTVQGLPASRWIRMAQSSTGAGYGVHFPLRKGTEVMIGHAGGDPDRPVIMGAIPNAVTPSPVTSGNATQHVHQTASSIRVEMEDLQG
ncbi:MAG: type VI secretion system tip protein TssI/VgrG, partial [Myxococcota bacterium]